MCGWCLPTPPPGRWPPSCKAASSEGCSPGGWGAIRPALNSIMSGGQPAAAAAAGGAAEYDPAKAAQTAGGPGPGSSCRQPDHRQFKISSHQSSQLAASLAAATAVVHVAASSRCQAWRLSSGPPGGSAACTGDDETIRWAPVGGIAGNMPAWQCLSAGGLSPEAAAAAAAGAWPRSWGV